MNAVTDAELLDRYARRGDEAAFGELVRRHLDLVYSAARRLVADPHLAEDVSQGVFSALAGQAVEVAGRLGQGTPLSGWLHVTTRNLSAKAVRGEARRRQREQEAHAMQSPNESADALWDQISPHLDHALAELPEPDRDALLLRFFERRTAKEIGVHLGVGEEAAQKRVNRALDRLRGVFVARGLAVPVTGLAGAITAHAVQAAPAGLAVAIGASLATGAGAGLGITFLKIMTTTKVSTVVGTLAIAGLLTVAVIQQRERARLQTQLAALRAEQTIPAASAEAVPAQAAEGQSDELLRLRGEVAQLRRQEQELQRLAAENARLRAAQTATAQLGGAPNAELEAFRELGLAKMNYARSWSIAFMLYADENGGVFPPRMEDAAAFLGETESRGRFGPDQFELLYHGPLKDLKDPARTIVLREKEATPNPERPGWVRTYLFADGHCEIHHSDDGNHEAWEKDRQPELRPPTASAGGL